MATETARHQARGMLERLARADMDTDGFRCEAAKVLREAVGFEWWCWDLLDPGVELPPGIWPRTRSLAAPSGAFGSRWSLALEAGPTARRRPPSPC
jgi:hypothetical protein